MLVAVKNLHIRRRDANSSHVDQLNSTTILRNGTVIEGIRWPAKRPDRPIALGADEGARKRVYASPLMTGRGKPARPSRCERK